MLAMFNGQPIFGPRGPAGSDGNPIGTIISYMGLSAPTDYLICDGSIYDIFEYSKLAEFFKIQFGAENYFGGDGATTFAVPDMRNLFLRGFHGTSEEQLSGEVGIKQEATKIPNVYVSNDGRNIYGGYVGTGSSVVDADSKVAAGRYFTSTGTAGSDPLVALNYTSRPVNMAVLYCIKAIEVESNEDIYSTEETRIGTWLDGKPLYRKVIKVTTPASGKSSSKVAKLEADVDSVVSLSVSVEDSAGQVAIASHYHDDSNYIYVYYNKLNSTPTDRSDTVRMAVSSIYANRPAIIIIEYTKMTDIATII